MTVFLSVLKTVAPPDLHRGRLAVLATGSTEPAASKVGGLGRTVLGQGPIAQLEGRLRPRHPHLGELPSRLPPAA
jgi:hypothetical protein